MLKIALAGNPNSGKTTLFNALTGSTAHVGNWPGVTVEKREGVCKKGSEPVAVVDLPGIYSLSPYTPEEVVARGFLFDEKPDCVIDVVDVTNLERNLYLTTQLMELDIPVVVALNMSDALRRAGDKLDAHKLEKELGLPVAEISALKNEGLEPLIERAIRAARSARKAETVLQTSRLAPLIGELTQSLQKRQAKNPLFCAIRLLEGDADECKAFPAEAERIRQGKKGADKAAQPSAGEKGNQTAGEADETDYEAEIADARYKYIAAHFAGAVKRAARGDGRTRSDRADRILTHRIWGIPIFLAVLFALFHLTFSTDLLFLNTIVGWFNKKGFAFDADTGNEVLNGFVAVFFTADGVAAPGTILFNLMGFICDQIGSGIANGLESAGAAAWAQGLVNDGIWAGLSGVLSFIPQILFLFLLLSVLEDSGYMARVAFILDRAFRRFGLSGRAFIPMIMGFGCSVPAAVNTRTLSDEKERIMTCRVIPFFTCGAKAPILAAVCGAIVRIWNPGIDAGMMTFLLYLFGMVMAVITVALMRQTSMRGETAPFIMELPAYRAPRPANLAVHLWDKLKHYIQKAFTIIVASSIVIWFLSHFSWEWQYLPDERMNESILHDIGAFVQWACTPMGFGYNGGAMRQTGWVFVVAAVTGLIAKENVISTFFVLGNCLAAAAGAEGALSEETMEGWQAVSFLVAQTGITWQGLVAFTAFNMLTVPCFAAAATVRAELPKGKFRYTVAFWMLTSYTTATVLYLALTWWWTAILFAGAAALLVAGLVLRNRGRRCPLCRHKVQEKK